MSSVSSIGSGSSLIDYLKQLAAAQSSQQTAGTPRTPGASATSAASASGAAGQSEGVQGKHHHHHGGKGGGGNSLFQQIDTAVTNALQAAKSSGNTSDPNQIIQQAIAQALGGTSAPGTSNTTSTTSPSTNSTAAGGAGSAGGPQAFFQALQGVGVTPDQFRSDFMAALQQVMGGQASANSSAASGVLLDTAA